MYFFCVVTATYNCRATAFSCTSTGTTHNPGPIEASNGDDIVRTSSSMASGATSDRPYPTPPVSTSTEPFITTEETTIVQQTTENSTTSEPAAQDSTEIESTPLESVEDDSSRTVSRRVSSQPGVIAGVVLAIFAVIFLTVITSLFVAVVISKKQNKKSSVTHTNEQFQDISNGN